MLVKNSSPLGVSPVGSLIAYPKIDFVIRTVEIGGRDLTFYEVLTPFANIKLDKTPTTPISSEDRKKSIDQLKIHSRSIKRSNLYPERITLPQASAHVRRFRGSSASISRILALKPRMKRKDWLILGNSPEIVRKHYAKWSPARQSRIDDLMQRVHAGVGYVAEDTTRIQ
jgi:hypothetical protein